MDASTTLISSIKLTCAYTGVELQQFETTRTPIKGTHVTLISFMKYSGHIKYIGGDLFILTNPCVDPRV